MKYPKFINKGDVIGIIAPSAGAYSDQKKNKFKNAKKNLEEKGFKVKTSNYLYNDEKGRSTTKFNRAKEINDISKNNNIDFVLSATGGDFCIETLPYINFEDLSNCNKFVAGFSDPTCILFPLTTKYDVATIYGQNFSPFGMEKLHKSQEDFINIITGKSLEEESYESYENSYQESVTGLEYYNLDKKVLWKILDNKDVLVTGRIIGGCLDIISELSSTKYDGTKTFIEKYKNDGIIWYFDNCELSCDATIRVLWKLKELGYFKYTKAIIFGRFGREESIYGYTTKTCLEDSVLSELNIPIIYDTDITHKSPCLTIINGSIATISVKNNKGKIKFELK